MALEHRAPNREVSNSALQEQYCSAQTYIEELEQQRRQHLSTKSQHRDATKLKSSYLGNFLQVVYFHNVLESESEVYALK